MLANGIWAIDRGFLPELELRLRRGPGEPQADSPRSATRSRDSRTADGGIRVINVFGVITQWPAWFSDASTVAIRNELDEAVASSQVKRIVLNIDSPGGSVFGVQELGDAIYSARGKKPIVAIANSQAASAAYWIGSAAAKLYAAPGGITGSVGVIATHFDLSAMNEKLGVKPTYITAGKYKAEGNYDEPLSKEARAELQRRVDFYYEAFVGAVARNRAVSRTEVLAKFGQGRIMNPADAKAAGMIDGIETLGGLLTSQSAAASMYSASADDGLRRLRWRHLRRQSDKN